MNSRTAPVRSFESRMPTVALSATAISTQLSPPLLRLDVRQFVYVDEFTILDPFSEILCNRCKEIGAVCWGEGCLLDALMQGRVPADFVGGGQDEI